MAGRSYPGGDESKGSCTSWDTSYMSAVSSNDSIFDRSTSGSINRSLDRTLVPPPVPGLSGSLRDYPKEPPALPPKRGLSSGLSEEPQPYQQPLTRKGGSGRRQNQSSLDSESGSQNRTFLSESGRGGQNQSLFSESGRGGQNQSLFSESGRGGQNQSLFSESGRGGQNQSLFSESGRGGQNRTLSFKSEADRQSLPSVEEFDNRPSEISRDTTFISGNVMALQATTFENFIKSKEKALIFFYEGKKARIPKTENEFSGAADLPLKSNYGFGAVDCLLDPCLCDRHNISKKPMMKLFSNGFEMSSLTDIDNFTTNQMQMLMKMTPVLSEARFQKGQEILQQPSPLLKTKKGSCFGKLFK